MDDFLEHSVVKVLVTRLIDNMVANGVIVCG